MREQFDCPGRGLPKRFLKKGGHPAVDLSVQDRLDILELYARHAHSIDANNGDEYAECFTRDGLFAATTGRIAGKTFRGRDELRALGNDPAREPPTRHWTCNYIFTPRSDHIEGRCYVMRIEVGGNEPVIAASAVYHDEIVHEDGRWRFRARRPQLDLQRRPSAADAKS
jgi:SnoaL-like domain